MLHRPIEVQAPGVSPLEPGTGGDVPGHYEGGGGGVALTPTGYDEPLELPGSSHYISLAKFLEVGSLGGGMLCF